MSSSFVLALGALGLPGVAVVHVIAVALGLLSAMALALWRAGPRPCEVMLADAQPRRGGRRPLELTTLCAPTRRWLGSRGRRPGATPAEGEPAPAESPEHARVPVMGYATFSDRTGKESDDELGKQADVIARACEQRGLVLLEMVGDPHLDQGPVRPRLSDARPGLLYALGRIAAGDARGLVIPGLRRLTRSVAELGPILEWCMHREARLVAVAQGFDTGKPESRFAARLIIEVSRWERERLSEPPREGQSSSRGVAASAPVDDDPDLLSHSGGESS
jgi:Resolvase, N terminal domain